MNYRIWHLLAAIVLLLLFIGSLYLTYELGYFVLFAVGWGGGSMSILELIWFLKFPVLISLLLFGASIYGFIKSVQKKTSRVKS